ncbi:dTDP-4-dehydrorhamnose reductase [Longirhabdus pacifica]|uniref:dTDP-4-dehydrorhamnose reductase n=1 Tax=Longirhabdus pacifica TaxID=2305227 RepID=UPI0013E8B209|nr:dTDP-4-dehydrorhamnose reductase [Longirhabdus pacifica]
MKIHRTEIEGVVIIESRVFEDHRGWFTEVYSKQKFSEQGIDLNFVQDNHSMSYQKGTLRGLHFQTNPKAQTKLVRCTKGKIYDVVVDLRKGSPTYKKWIGIELSDKNKKQLLVPKGFAHGFVTLTEEVEVQYKVDEYYSLEHDGSIRFDDPEIGVDWVMQNPILSEKDLQAPYLKDSGVDFSLKFMITGANSQLGNDIISKLKEIKLDVIAPGRDELELTEKKSVTEYILKEKPDVIIHCAAYTAVDKAEDENKLCYAVNVEGTRHVANAAVEIGAKLVYISTDYVFDGLGKDPQSETKETNPINYYGFTKEQGEKIVKKLVENYFIVRTSWVYGFNGNNFVKTMLKLAETNNEISVVKDQFGSPTYTKDLANFIVKLVKTNKYGTYHAVNEGYCSWHEFAKAIFYKSGIEMKVDAITTEEHGARARRPLNSRLSNENTKKAGIERLPHWNDALSRFLVELNIMED